MTRVLTQFPQSTLDRRSARFLPQTGYMRVYDAFSVPAFDDEFSDDIRIAGFNSFMLLSTVTGAGAFSCFVYTVEPNDPTMIHQRTSINHVGAGTLKLSIGAFSTDPTVNDVWFALVFEIVEGAGATRTYTLRLYGAKR